MLRLTDTATNSLLDFKPAHQVNMYVCGITPYDSAHLGHILTFLTYDLLQRRLEDIGHEVRLVRNITDVDEPIYQRAAENNEAYTDLAARESAEFQSVMSRLNFLPAAAEPRASEYIAEMAAAVSELLEDGFAYKLADDIYFDVSKANDYGGFAGFGETLLVKLAADRGGDPDREGKRNRLDFLLWKGISDQHDPAAWDTALGRGRPGWHIECSVMSHALLGMPFDIHGGGSDLVFPHHESEIAQAYGLGRKQVANVWLHVAPLMLYGEKMSKSLGNLVFAKDLLADYEPSVIRLAFMHYRYNIGGEWRPCFLQESVVLLERLRTVLPKLPHERLDAIVEDLRDSLDDDLDVSRGIHLLDVATRDINAQGATPAKAQLQTIEHLLGITL